MRTDNETPVHTDRMSLENLFTQYLRGQAGRLAAGAPLPELGSELELHDASPLQGVDPRLAWDEAVAALRTRSPKATLASATAVPDWGGLVAAQEPALDLAFAAGNFPQMVRNLTLLLKGEAPEATSPPRPQGSPTLKAWAEAAGRETYPRPLLAAGVLRLAKEYDGASRILDSRVADCPDDWKPALRNEQAALAWHAGRTRQALALWQQMGDGFVPALFNQGMAALFLDRPADALDPLRRAVSALPESGSWHHLARLYLTLAEVRQ
jgi:hypothetical protein